MVENQDSVDRVFFALSDGTRRQIFSRLSDKELSLSEVARPLSISLQGVSKHVAILEDAGLVRREKRGRQVFCLAQPHALERAARFIETYSIYWNAQLDALDEALKGSDDD